MHTYICIMLVHILSVFQQIAHNKVENLFFNYFFYDLLLIVIYTYPQICNVFSNKVFHFPFLGFVKTFFSAASAKAERFPGESHSCIKCVAGVWYDVKASSVILSNYFYFYVNDKRILESILVVIKIFFGSLEILLVIFIS